MADHAADEDFVARRPHVLGVRQASSIRLGGDLLLGPRTDRRGAPLDPVAVTPHDFVLFDKTGHTGSDRRSSHASHETASPSAVIDEDETGNEVADQILDPIR